MLVELTDGVGIEHPLSLSAWRCIHNVHYHLYTVRFDIARQQAVLIAPTGFKARKNIREFFLLIAYYWSKGWLGASKSLSQLVQRITSDVELLLALSLWALSWSSSNLLSQKVNNESSDPSSAQRTYCGIENTKKKIQSKKATSKLKLGTLPEQLQECCWLNRFQLISLISLIS